MKNMKTYEVLSIFTYTFSKLVPKKKNRWVFGAWFGNAVSDNSKWFSDFIRENHPEIEIIWITKKTDNIALQGVKAVKRNSLQSLKYILTAQVAVMNQGFGDFNALNFLGSCYKIQLWHGVAWKKIVRDAMPEAKKIGEKIYRRIFDYINQYDLFVAPSEEYGNVLQSAFGVGKEKIVYTGQPRNIALFDKEYCEQAKKQLQEKLGVDNKKIIVYMPTFRDKTNDVFTFCDGAIENQISEIARKENFVIVEKSHFKTTQRNHQTDKDQYGCVYTLPNADAQWLLAAADMLITDYSSCFFDFLIRNKPIIHYVYDYEYYKSKDRGVYYDIEDVAAGDCVFDLSSLINAIEKNLKDPETCAVVREKIRRKFVSYENPNNCKDIFQRVKEKL